MPDWKNEVLPVESEESETSELRLDTDTNVDTLKSILDELRITNMLLKGILS